MRRNMSDTDKTEAAVQVRLRGPLYQALENWRRSQPKIPPRSEALRGLLELALAKEPALGKATTS
jgi:hypothetical protein